MKTEARLTCMTSFQALEAARMLEAFYSRDLGPKPHESTRVDLVTAQDGTFWFAVSREVTDKTFGMIHRKATWRVQEADGVPHLWVEGQPREARSSWKDLFTDLLLRAQELGF